MNYADRVLETSTTTGTGTLTLGGSQTGYSSFLLGIGSGNQCYYVIDDGTDFEIGIGTFTTGASDTLSRTTVLRSSNGGALVDFQPGTKNVYVDVPAAIFSGAEQSEINARKLEGLDKAGLQALWEAYADAGDASTLAAADAYADAGDAATLASANAHADAIAASEAATAEANADAYTDAQIANLDVTTFGETTPATITGANNAYAVNHGAGGVPKLFFLAARCISADGGYAVGDEINMASANGTAEISVWANATQIGISSGNTFSNMFTVIPNRAGGTTSPSESSFKWVAKWIK